MTEGVTQEPELAAMMAAAGLCQMPDRLRTPWLFPQASAIQHHLAVCLLPIQEHWLTVTKAPLHIVPRPCAAAAASVQFPAHGQGGPASTPPMRAVSARTGRGARWEDHELTAGQRDRSEDAQAIPATTPLLDSPYRDRMMVALAIVAMLLLVTG